MNQVKDDSHVSAMDVVHRLFGSLATPALALPRPAKRAIALAVDGSLCVLTVWLAFYLRLGMVCKTQCAER